MDSANGFRFPDQIDPEVPASCLPSTPAKQPGMLGRIPLASDYNYSFTPTCDHSVYFQVFCTKSKPNCNACPMRGECKHFASAFASSRLALPGLEEKGLVTSRIPDSNEMRHNTAAYPISLLQLEANSAYKPSTKNVEPIIEEPATPEPESLEYLESAIEDAFYEDPHEIPTIRLNIEQFTQNLHEIMQEKHMVVHGDDMSKLLIFRIGSNYPTRIRQTKVVISGEREKRVADA